MIEEARPVVQVACGVLQRADGTVLLAQRPAGKIAEGYWEFPGGKIEPGEQPLEALSRELHEELGIAVTAAEPLIRFAHDYSNRRVILDTWRVTAFAGEPTGRERQALRWALPSVASDVGPLLPTVLPTLKALAVSAHYVFTRDVPDPLCDPAALAQLPRGAWLRLRWPQLDDAAYARAARDWLPAAQLAGLKVLLDRAPALVSDLGADGWHASAAARRAGWQRPDGGWAVASVHTAAELEAVAPQGFDAAVLGAVAATATHPGSTPLGWLGFAAHRGVVALPVFAIGGLAPASLAEARRHGAQGVAGISAYW